jgi:hypothetical protein
MSGRAHGRKRPSSARSSLTDLQRKTLRSDSFTLRAEADPSATHGVQEPIGEGEHRLYQS